MDTRINRKDEQQALLRSTGNLLRACDEPQRGRTHTQTHTWLSHSALQQTVTPHCKATKTPTVKIDYTQLIEYQKKGKLPNLLYEAGKD